MISLFRKKKIIPLQVDLHSHLIPGIDDGVKDLEHCFAILYGLKKLGYQKVITTPHIHPRYPNSPKTILSGLEKVQQLVKSKNLDLEVEAAAEYFVDDDFIRNLEEEQPLLSFGDRFVLVETSFINKPLAFENILFKMMAQGYRPILAHPERYQYLGGELDWLLELKDMGVSLQVTLSSFVGYYGDMPKKVAEKLLKSGNIDFLGSDLHRISQLEPLGNALRLSRIQRSLEEMGVRNHELI